SNRFILEAFDRTLLCPIAQASLEIVDIDKLRSILSADDDPKLEKGYCLDDKKITAIVSAFDTFDPRQIADADLEISIFRWLPPLFEVPYLVHTGYELPLLLDGRKKLACMTHYCPPATFPGEERFDHLVANGFLHREEVVVEVSEIPTRWVYYTPKGEEWR